MSRWLQLATRAADRFNEGFERLSHGYGRLTRRLLLRPKKMLLTYAGLIAATFGLFWATPTGFVPQQDQGYFLAAVFLPSGSSLERTDEVTREVAQKILPPSAAAHFASLFGVPPHTAERRERAPPRFVGWNAHALELLCFHVDVKAHFIVDLALGRGRRLFAHASRESHMASGPFEHGLDRE